MLAKYADLILLLRIHDRSVFLVDVPRPSPSP